MNLKDTELYLKSLQEDGIQEVYWPAPQKKLSFQRERPAAAAILNPPSTESISIEDLRAEALRCTKCSTLCASRKNVVFGHGNLQAELVFVGEAPGRDEDEQGLPFVGAAGQLLTKIIEAIGYTRSEVYICNVLKCRPPANREPHPDEIINCRPYLHKQLSFIKPVLICALGNYAAQTLLSNEKPMSALRGKMFTFEGLNLMCTYHPAYLLRNPSEKKKVWEDVKMMRREIDRRMGREPRF